MGLNIFSSMSLTNPLVILLFLLFFVIIPLLLYIVEKAQSISSLKKEVAHLNGLVQDFDMQAKLIIKSDMELKLYQQNIESELNKLTIIKNLIISSTHTLDKEKLFSQINEQIINDIGFKKGLILDFDNLDTKVNIGLENQEITKLKEILKHKKNILKGIQLLSFRSEMHEQLSQILQTKETLLAPVEVRENTYAIFLVTDLLLNTEIEKLEQEAFLIICMHLSRCLDNIRLFEDLYHIKDNLERKIKERTNELVKSLKAIETINKAKSDFVSSVSHELRTPLTSIKGFSSLLVGEKFGKLPEEARRRLTKIDQNVNKLINIVNTLLDISRIESGKVEIKIAPFELTKLIKDTTDFLSPQIEAKGINLVLDTPASLNVYMDKNLIERVLINLINNAIKFTPKDKKIKISCEKNNGQAVVSVSDTGCGIEKNDLDKVFQEFFRVNNPINNKVTGSGLGLSLVKKIIDIHKEKLWVESEAGAGTTFYFTLKVIENA